MILKYNSNNKYTMSWSVVLFTNDSKTEILNILHVETMANVSYILGIGTCKCSNRYHNLIRPTGLFKKITIIKKI